MILDKVEVGHRIARLSYDRGISLYELADKIEISYLGLWKMTRGCYFPKLETLAKMSRVLGVTIGYILGVEEC